jgi:hypothetical protein
MVYLCFDDGTKIKLNTKPYVEWERETDYEGASDLAYEEWKRSHGVSDLDEFDLFDEGYWLEELVDEV